MTDDEIYDGLNIVFRRQFKDEGIVTSPIMTSADVNGWDSLAHIRLILAVEKQFGVKFKTSEIAGFDNVGDLVAMVKEKTC